MTVALWVDVLGGGVYKSGVGFTKVPVEKARFGLRPIPGSNGTEDKWCLAELVMVGAENPEDPPVEAERVEDVGNIVVQVGTRTWRGDGALLTGLSLLGLVAEGTFEFGVSGADLGGLSVE